VSATTATCCTLSGRQASAIRSRPIIWGWEIQPTTLPFVIDGSLTTLRAHFSCSNPQWRTIHRCSALVIAPRLMPASLRTGTSPR
jgi:predicted FMN-binding regulatory protein PaiB